MQCAERDEWVQRCARRLGELDPRRPLAALTAKAEELWDEVSAFSPEIAAEMEHEAGWSDQ